MIKIIQRAIALDRSIIIHFSYKNQKFIPLKKKSLAGFPEIISDKKGLF